jgi:hypothetical protein
MNNDKEPAHTREERADEPITRQEDTAPQRVVLEYVSTLRRETSCGFVNLGARVYNFYPSEAAYFAHKAPPPPAPVVEPAREPGIPPLLKPPYPKSNPKAAQLVKGEPPLAVQQEWLEQPASFFAKRLWQPDDLIGALVGQRQGVYELSEIVRKLDLYNRLCPQPMRDRRSGEPKEWRYVVTRFEMPKDIGKQWRRISFLSKRLHLCLLILDPAAMALEAWFLAAGDHLALENFMREAIDLGADPRSASPRALAHIPAGLSARADDGRARLALQSLGVTRDVYDWNKRHLAGKNLVLRFDPQ